MKAVRGVLNPEEQVAIALLRTSADRVGVMRVEAETPEIKGTNV